MASESSPYTEHIDLTTRSRRENRRKKAMEDLGDEAHEREVGLEELPDRIQQAAHAIGWTELMEVQRRAIPLILEDRDLMVQARTGTGKTGAFLLPLFELLDHTKQQTQALILTPTRELARQIHGEFEQMKLATTETHELEAALVYGGVSYGPQIRALKKGVQVIAGTPGRVLDHLKRGNFSTDGLTHFILDEADEMLSMGFLPDIEEIKGHLPSHLRTYLFSATMPPKVRSLGLEFMDNPGFLSLSVGQMSVEAIEHRYYLVNQMDKDRALVRLIEMEEPDSALIFTNTKRSVSYLRTFLHNYGYEVDEISGDLSQKAREKAMGRIRRGELRFLVATDVAARGIDISELSHVFIYDVPQDPEYYVHRTGRTARAGRQGAALALATHEDEYQLKRIGARYGIDIKKAELPSVEEVGRHIAGRLEETLRQQKRAMSNLEQERLEFLVPAVKELAEHDPELLAMFLEDAYDQLHSEKNKGGGTADSKNE